MNTFSSDLNSAVQELTEAIDGAQKDSGSPLFVCVDGRSGSGKSTIAGMVAPRVDAVVVPTDDFYAANISDAEWDERTPARRAADAIDWRRFRAEVRWY